MSSMFEKLIYLINGYMTNIQTLRNDNQYPNDVILIVMRFVAKLILQFDLINPRYRHCIKNNGKLLIKSNMDNEMFSVLSSNVFKPGDIGLFKVKCIKPGGDAIGIISNTDIINKINGHHAYLGVGTFTYYYHGRGKLYLWKGKKMKNQVNVTRWNENDIITVKVDCMKWNIIFMKNNAMVGGITEIKPQSTYYPLIGTSDGNVEYQLL